MGGYNVDKNAGLIIGDGDFSVIGGTLDITENGVYDVTTYKNVDVDYNVKNEDVTVTPELYEQEITPSAGYDGLGIVRVESRPLNLQSKQVAPSELTTFVTADEGYDGLSSVTVDNYTISLQNKVVEPTSNTQLIEADEGYDGLSSVSVTGTSYMNIDLQKWVNQSPDDEPFEMIFEKAVRNYIAYGQIKMIKATILTATSIGGYAFYGCTALIKVNLPDSLTSIGNSAFGSCSSLTELALPDSLTIIGAGAFQNCSSLTELSLPDSLTSIGNNAFGNCSSLTELSLPDSLTSIGGSAFGSCSSLTVLTLAQGFNCNGLNVSASTHFTAETIVACLEALADRTGQTAYTITFGTTNLNKLTAEQKAIAINKNWNLN